MKAAIINEYGSADVVEIAEDFPYPVISNGKVIIEIHDASINPFDYKIRLGYMKDMLPLQFPKVLCMDLAGVITEVADDVEDFKIGDEIYGQADFFQGGGSLAEFSTANVGSIAKKPTNLDFYQASALPLVAVSAYQALVDNMSLKDSQKLLIQGGAGGIGSIAIQLAKHLGAYVATTVATKDVEFAKSLGANQVIDYSKEDFSTILTDFDAVLDLVGGEAYQKSFEILKPEGVIVSLGEQPNSELSEKYSVNARYQGSQVNTEALQKVTVLVEQEAIKPLIDKSYKLIEAKEAFAHLENDHPQGKIIVTVK